MNPALLSILACPQCGDDLVASEGGLICHACNYFVPVREGKPILTPVPSDMVPSPKSPAPKEGTLWRRANWTFCEQMAREFLPQEIVLDVGAGNGYFKSLFEHTVYIATDVYPYSNVDFVCDITILNPLRPASVDAIILANTLEHVLDGQVLLTQLVRALKPGGRLLATVPFLVKVHQAPHDFARYTRFALSKMLTRAGADVVKLEAVYAPFYLVQVSLRNLAELYRPTRGLGGMTKRTLISVLLLLIRLLRRISPEVKPLMVQCEQELETNPSPIGYQVVARRWK